MNGRRITCPDGRPGLRVSRDKKLGKWRAQIRVAGHNRYIGNYDTIEEASDAYRRAKSELHPFWAQAS